MRPYFEQFLANMRLNYTSGAHTHNAWLTRCNSDPAAQRDAQFHMPLQQYAARHHFGDVADMSQDIKSGITLDQYARLSAAPRQQAMDPDTMEETGEATVCLSQTAMQV